MELFRFIFPNLKPTAPRPVPPTSMSLAFIEDDKGKMIR